MFHFLEVSAYSANFLSFMIGMFFAALMHRVRAMMLVAIYFMVLAVSYSFVNRSAPTIAAIVPVVEDSGSPFGYLKHPPKPGTAYDSGIGDQQFARPTQ
jgi:hypothetical protein